MRTALLILLSVVTITALPSGLIMMYDPEGTSLGLATYMLFNTPFQDYFIPGLLLLIFVGGSNLISLLLVMSQSTSSYKWSLISGTIVAVWILGEFLFIPYYHWLQGLYLAAGILIALTSYQLMGKAAI
jgi:hypothetical protein